jgi:RNA polymerase sigma-70 factor (ECF subfamily)
MDQEDLKGLIARVSQGDHDAFEVLWAWLLPSLRQTVRRLVAGHEADDVVQETGVRLWRWLREGKFDPAAGQLRQVAATMARNCATDHLRSRQTRSHEGLPEEGEEETPSVPSREEDPAEQVMTAELREQFQRAMQDLPERYRQVLELHSQGLSGSEIGERIGLTRARVSQLIQEAVEMIRRRDSTR